MRELTVKWGKMPCCVAFLNNAHTACNRMAESSSADTRTSSNFSDSSHSINFNAYTSDFEVNSIEAGPSSRVAFLLDCLKSPT